jgi:hypothetical protein
MKRGHAGRAARKILDEDRLPQHFLKVTHKNKHACCLRQDWPAR